MFRQAYQVSAKAVRSWLSSPWQSLALCIFSVAISLLITHYSTGRKVPVYMVSGTYFYVAAEREPDIKVLWQGQEVKQAYLVFVTLMNDGNEPIDAKDLVETSPITIQAADSVHVLYAKAASSRSNLGLSADINRSSVRINWLPDEALEPGDGGVIRIIYESAKPTEFRVTGRVKGVSNGFIRTSGKILAVFYLVCALGIFVTVWGPSDYFILRYSSKKTALRDWQSFQKSPNFLHPTGRGMLPRDSSLRTTRASQIIR